MSKFTRRNGCAAPEAATGVTTARHSRTSAPVSHASPVGAAGSVAVYGVPPIVNVTDAAGTCGAKVPPAVGAEAIA